MSEDEVGVPSFSDIAKKLIPTGKSFYTQNEMLQIYTDWANHYLERSPRHKRLIQDLQHDISDGVLLADIVDAVTNERLRDIKTKPKNGAQMLENVNICLKCIENLGVNIEGLNAEDIREGNLRAILGLFFSLSRYKQQKKSGLLPPSNQSQLLPPGSSKLISAVPGQTDEMLSRLPSPFKSAQSNRNSTGAIPVGCTAPPNINGQNRRSLISSQKDKVSGSSSGIPGPRPAQNSRPVSPGAANSPHSLIPIPSKLPSTGDRIRRQSRSSSNTSSGISLASSTNKPGQISWPISAPTSIPVPSSIAQPAATSVTAMGKGGGSMFAFFQKTKQDKPTSAKVASASKQTVERNSGCSSSSGFSSGSAKGELSDNSSGAGSETLISTPVLSSHPKESVYENASASITSSPKLAMKAFAKRISSRSPGSSVKDSSKLVPLEHDDEQTRSRLPAPSSSEAVAGRLAISSKLQKPAVSHVSGGSLRPPTDVQLSPPGDTLPPSLQRSVGKKSDGPPPPIRSSVLDGADLPRESSNKPTGLLPTPSSGIPRPLVASTKISAKSAKTEKRLSFTPNTSELKGAPSSRKVQSKTDDIKCIDEVERSDVPVVPSVIRSRDSIATTTLPEHSTPEKKTKLRDSDSPQRIPAVPNSVTDNTIWKLNQPQYDGINGQQNSFAVTGESSQNGGQQAPGQNEVTVCEAVNSAASTRSIPCKTALQNISASHPTEIQSIAPVQQSSALLTDDAGISQSNSDRNQTVMKQATANRAVRTSSGKTESGRWRGKDANTGVSGGYASDGDTLKTSGQSSQLRVFDEDALNGYISEGSASMAGNIGSPASRRLTGRARERMPLVRESGYAQGQYSNGRGDGFDYDDIVPKNGCDNWQTDRKTNDGSHHSRTFPHSSLSYRGQYSDSDDIVPRPSVPAMPLLRGSSIRSSESSANGPRSHRPGPVSPPPRDPETTLSDPSRSTSGHRDYPGSSTSADNYHRIYASPVPTRSRMNDVNSGASQNDTNPGDLFSRGYDNRLQNSHHKNTLERHANRTLGGTQTNAPENGGCSKQSTGTHYSTNSLNRNSSRHGLSGHGYSPCATDGPPRCRSVVQSHGEMSIAPPPSGYSSHVGMVNPYMPVGNGSVYESVPVSPKMTNYTSPSRFSMMTQHGQDLSISDIDRIPSSSVASLPPKSSRTVRYGSTSNGDAHDPREYERNSRSSGGQSGQEIYARNGPHQDGSSRDNYLNAPSTWEPRRSPSHVSRTHPLAYNSLHTHSSNYSTDDTDDASTVSFPISVTSRTLAPGSPILSYSLPRTGQSNVLSLLHNQSPNLLSKMHVKDDEVHGSSGSLMSTASSIYSTPEERHAYEVRKLRRELEQAQERVTTLTSHLSENTNVVSAFVHSLDSISKRLDNLTSSTQRKDGELVELRRVIENLRRQGAEAGLINGPSSMSPSLTRRHTFNSGKDPVPTGETDERPPPGLSRQMSTDSVVSLNSLASNCSTNELDEDGKKKNKKKSWVQSKERQTIGVSVRASFGKAFSRMRPKLKQNGNTDAADDRGKSHLQSDLSTSVPNSPLLHTSRAATSRGSRTNSIDHSIGLKSASSFSELGLMDERDETVLVEDLQRQLREKEMILNDFRLDALNSASQLDQYRESMNRMKNEIENLRQDNLRLQRLVTVKRRSLSSERKSPHDAGARSTPSESGIGDDESPTFDSRRIAVKVATSENGCTKSSETEDISIGSIKISPVMRWDQMDRAVRQLFKEYISRLDAVSSLDLSPDSIACYHIGSALRNRDDLTSPDSSPCDFIKNDNEKIRVILKGSREHALDLITFESLIPKYILQKYASLISEHNRIIICGPSGTGKSRLAEKIAQHVVLKSGRQTMIGAVVTFTVDENTVKDLRQNLMQIAERCENRSDLELTDIPSVVIIDNLHHVASLGELFNGFLSVKHYRCPFIIGTMNQSTCKPENSQLHHNFHWIMYQTRNEPVKGYLSRYLRRKITEHEMNVGVCDSALTRIVEWIPKVWQHINSSLEKNSSDLTLGPRWFLECPMKVRESQLWFTLLWNHSLLPYVLEALKTYGLCAPWEDPLEWILTTYPWPSSGNQDESETHNLKPVRSAEFGFDSCNLDQPAPSASVEESVDEAEVDPLTNMISHLQEAARCSGKQIDLTKNNESPMSTLNK